MNALSVLPVPFSLEPLLSYGEWEKIQGTNTIVKEKPLQYSEFL